MIRRARVRLSLAAVALVGVAPAVVALPELPRVTAVIAPASVAQPVAPGPIGESAPPGPPVVRVTPPRGLKPGSAPGIRASARCAPPGADAPGVPPGAGGVSARLRLADVQQLATGRGQVIAVIDTGIGRASCRERVSCCV